MPRKPHKYNYIYLTTCLVNRKYYIGMHSTNNLDDGYIGSGKSLHRSLNKYGYYAHSIEVIEFLSDRESLKIREKEIVNETLLTDPMCMNLMIGGIGGFHGNIEAARIYGRNSFLKLWKNPEFKKRKIKEASILIKKLRIEGKVPTHYPTWTGKQHTNETKNLMSEKAKIRIGILNNQFGTCWIYNLNLKENRKIKKKNYKAI